MMVPLVLAVVLLVGPSRILFGFVAACLFGFAFIDYYTVATQTLAVIFVCSMLCVIVGVPVGIAMSRSDRLQRTLIPILDMLQTLPAFVSLLPLIFLFSVTEPKSYGLVIILYSIVPVLRLTDLGIRLVDVYVIDAASAFGRSDERRVGTECGSWR